MRLRGSLGLLALTATLTACASSITPGDGGEDGSATNDGIAVQDRVAPPADRVTPPTDGGGPVEDVVLPGEDVIEPPPMDVVIPGEDVVVPPMDSTVEDTGVPPTDSGVVTDTGVPPTDSGVGPACHVSGLNDNCPAMGSMGACAPLTAGMRTINLDGLSGGIAASCEGMGTSAGPDGVVPLVLTEASDVRIQVGGVGAGAVTVSLFTGGACGVGTGQRGCVNTNRGAAQTLSVNNLPAGTYWVAFSTEATMPSTRITVNTTITASPPRLVGDTCPGTTVPTTGMDTNISLNMFQRTLEVPTRMCPNIGGNVDFVFSYVVPTTSDVTIAILSPGGTLQAVVLDVQSTCGDASTSIGTCAGNTNGGSTQRVLSRQAPGTYYVVGQARAGATLPTLIANIRLATPMMPGPADMCPGIPLSDGMESTVNVASLGQDQAFSCFAASTADGNFSFNAPAGQDVLVEASSGTNLSALELQSPCRMNSTGCIATTVPGRAWQRYSGLTAGQSYSVHAGTNASTAAMMTPINMGVRFRAIPPLSTTAVTGNESCASASTIPATGGVFTGNTAMMAANSAAPTFGGGATCNGCNTAAGRDAVYRLTLTARTRVLAKLTGAAANFDPVIYVRQGMTCQDGMTGGAGAGILFCADDYYGQNSAFDRVLDPGTYHFFVDDCVPGGGGGGGARGGAYSLEVITLAP
jgi:hypothetical protein